MCCRYSSPAYQCSIGVDSIGYSEYCISYSANNTEEGGSLLTNFWGVRTFWPVTFLGKFSM